VPKIAKTIGRNDLISLESFNTKARSLDYNKRQENLIIS
jgi:hypothetical protein